MIIQLIITYTANKKIPCGLWLDQKKKKIAVVKSRYMANCTGLWIVTAIYLNMNKTFSLNIDIKVDL